MHPLIEDPKKKKKKTNSCDFLGARKAVDHTVNVPFIPTRPDVCLLFPLISNAWKALIIGRSRTISATGPSGSTADSLAPFTKTRNKEDFIERNQETVESSRIEKSG
jgi:hypothetical protein